LGTKGLPSLRVSYKSFPLRNRGVPEQTRIWRPILPVQIIYNHATSKKFEAVVDTGTDYCLFDANIGASIGIKILRGPEGDLGGVIPGPRSKVYYHDVKLVVGADIVEIKAGFSWDLSENLLGQIGFFDNFTVTFDPSPQPPCFEIHRVHRI
jgi:hypothetical protein